MDQFELFLAQQKTQYETDADLASHVDSIAKWLIGLSTGLLYLFWLARETLLPNHPYLTLSGTILVAITIPSGVIFRVLLYYYMRSGQNLHTVVYNHARYISAQPEETQDELWRDFYEHDPIADIQRKRTRLRLWISRLGWGILGIFFIGFALLAISFIASVFTGL